MNLRNRLDKIRIRLRERHRDRRGVPIQIEVKEKEYVICKNCSNRYNAFHVYCPQCLGIVEGNIRESASLKIMSVPAGKEIEIAQMLKTLSGKTSFDFKKALQSLPWTMIQDSEPEIITEWLDAFTSMNVKAEMTRETELKKRKRLLRSAPLFSSRAPVPSFFSPVTDAGIRHVASSLKDVSVRLKWVETV